MRYRHTKVDVIFRIHNQDKLLIMQTLMTD